MALDDELNDGTNDFHYFPDVLLHGVDSVLMVCDNGELKGLLIGFRRMHPGLFPFFRCKGTATLWHADTFVCAGVHCP
jgi:hypothetical protein